MKPVSLQYELDGEHRGRYRPQKWTCPHCQKENTLNLAGQILGVSKA